MTYPVDDNGNVRVDFVWGNFPLQPNEQRTDNSADWNDANNQSGDRGWTAPSYGATSDSLSVIYTQELSVGDQSNLDASWDDVDTRQVTVPSAHDIAEEGYNNYPAFLPNYAGDGDEQLEKVTPNVVGLLWSDALAVMASAGFVADSGSNIIPSSIANDNKILAQTPVAGAIVSSNAILVDLAQAPTVPNVVDFDSLEAAQQFLEDRGLVLGDSFSSEVGATAQNDGWVKSQSIPAGTKVDAGTAVDLTTYHYVLQPPVNPPSTTGPIAGFLHQAQSELGGSLNGDQEIMFLLGRTVRPAVGDTIRVTGTSANDLNNDYTVIAIANNDSYNTGGTSVKIQRVSGTATSTSSTGGTWTKL